MLMKMEELDEVEFKPIPYSYCLGYLQHRMRDQDEHQDG